MSRLADLQHRFQGCILANEAVVAPAWVSASGRADPLTQFTAYHFAYRARLQDVLLTDYPALYMAMGDDDFTALVSGYIEEHPSRHFSVREFGRHFPDFVRLKQAPWCAELALFEWTLREAFDAADAARLSEQALAAIAPQHWPQLRFVTHPSLRLCRFEWNVPQMWKLLTSDSPSEIEATANAATPWLIWRDGLITHYRSLAQDEYQALQCLCEGGDFDDICVSLIGFYQEAEVPLRAATLLKSWLGQGLLTQVLHEA